MIRATTPTHEYILPFNVENIDKLLITYKQGEKIVLEKTEADCAMEGVVASFSLTQEEMNLFEAEIVEIQVRILTTAGESIASNIITKTVFDVLNDKVL